MTDLTEIKMEKIMRRIIIVILWSNIFMIFNSCKPIDVTGSPFEEENFAPVIVSATPNPFGTYIYSALEKDTISVTITDLNEDDKLSVKWYIQGVGDPSLSNPKNPIIEENTYSITLSDNLNCTGLDKVNVVTLLVSDRGLSTNGLPENNNLPYPEKIEDIGDVKINLRKWVIKGCPSK